MATVTRIFLVDDHPLVRELLGKLLNLEPDFSVIGQAAEANVALAAICADPPDVAVVDLTLRKGSGLDLIKDLRAQVPSTAIVVLSMHEELTDFERAFRAGVLAYVMKQESTGQIVTAIREARAGRIFANPVMLARMTTRLMGHAGQAAPSPAERLSDRELEVFRRLGRGQSKREIGDALGVGLNTVQTYCARMKDKLGVESGQELLRLAYQWTAAQSNSEA